jgi:hypothetical protein
MFNEFPDYELVTLDKISGWAIENKKRLRYQTDAKFNNGSLAMMFDSYKKAMGNSQKGTLCKYYGDNEEQTFDNLSEFVRKNYNRFGRYFAYFYLQHLNHTAGIPNVPSSLMLNEHDPSESHRKGLLLALGMDDRLDDRFTSEEYLTLELKAKEILQEMRLRFPELKSELNFFTMETFLCAYKKLFRVRDGRYLGYYIARQAIDIENTRKCEWHGIDWDVLYQARTECLHKNVITDTIDKSRFEEFITYGSLTKLEMMFPEDKNNFGINEFFL